ncbi:transglutaminase family protein [Nocardia sp. BMG111209]|uniref:transglutaminase-like domain-containing protein n=1 Tax=Nocardia sp. BMG111209 TaxID=1160137 RepID=UPI000371EE6C|nr:transglutaminase family protein [Nocardia sp. BMG111209]
MNALLAPTPYLDHSHPSVAEFTAAAIGDRSNTLRDKAVDLYYAVRDGVNYEVYGTDISPDGLRASAVLSAGRGFCLHKSILYAATVRSVGIPSRILCSRVRNHLASPGLRALVGGEVFLHWYNEIHLDDRWIKATPVFNRLLCRMYGMESLEFDGRSDSIFHPTADGGRMEFLDEELVFDEVDPDRFTTLIAQAHPAMVTDRGTVPGDGVLAAEAPDVAS